MRKLGRASEAAILRVKHLQRGFDDGVNDRRRKPGAFSGKGLGVRDRTLDHLGLLHHVVVFFVIGIRDRKQHALEAGTSVVIVRRKISSTVKRLAVGSEESRQRPAALSADRTDGDLVAAVDVGTLVAIDLHGDETLVDDLRDFGIVVGLAVHDVAPVAPDRADIEQDGLVLALRRGKGVLAPFVPVDGLVHGRTQVGGRRLGERVERLGGHD